ncbi:heme NO-binding domain-containing protein [Algirhabdus cladophorae]|uniref:heme NO-binding domain-containing protein n=1 Tax=Algirhabdus cladophorae TaxID=3377108 RepID=UPI003B848CD1
MHGLINRSVECFIRDTYGKATWLNALHDANVPQKSFEGMLHYDDHLTGDVISATAQLLKRSESELLEDLGIYLVSHSNTQALRRLLRFGGVNFVDFLHSLDDLPGRARMAVADLDMPELELHQTTREDFKLYVRSDKFSFGPIVLGALRAMADDYGALVVMSADGAGLQGELISISVLSDSYTEGRSFQLSQPVAAHS